MKRQQVWNGLKDKMSGKRTRSDAVRKPKKAGSSAPHEIIVQRLASEPDNKQTFKPVQPREFVDFEFEEFSLVNLKKACAAHFNLPPGTCDVLVSNKGPSCTNIAQIPHRKDKVYLVRFVVQEDQPSVEPNADNNEEEYTEEGYCGKLSAFGKAKSASAISSKKSGPVAAMETAYPASVSIDILLKAGKLVKPQIKNKVTLTFEKFDVQSQKWVHVAEEELLVDNQKFSFGAFRDAFHASPVQGRQQSTQWVVKTYNSKAVTTIGETLNTSIEDHCRKQVQMHAVARHLAKSFKSKAPSQFGECFEYNRCFYTCYKDQPATVEEYVPGAFFKLINNDGRCMVPREDSGSQCKELYSKAQCLVHFTYHLSGKKLMLLDIQGSNYTLYDPEIATSDLVDLDTNEVYFCCGNCATVGMETFLEAHECNEFCKLMGLCDD